jgi:ketosteroid isomerase-like protein
MSTGALIQRYYDSLANHDNAWQNLYADDAHFSDASGTLDAQGRAAVIQSFTPFLKGVADVRVKQLIVDGGDACAVVDYTYVNQKGATMRQDVAEVWQVRGEKLAKLTIYFDLTAYRAFMRG